MEEEEAREVEMLEVDCQEGEYVGEWSAERCVREGGRGRGGDELVDYFSERGEGEECPYEGEDDFDWRFYGRESVTNSTSSSGMD